MMRLHILMARRGAASRRQAERLIAAGRVTVNGRVTTQAGAAADPDHDTVAIDGVPLPAEPPAPRLIMLHKPRGAICSHSSRQGRTVFDLLGDIPEKLICIGRLDKDSEGLLLLTTDGALANRLMHPRYGHVKTYRVSLAGKVPATAMRRLAQPVLIDGSLTQPARVELERHDPAGDRTWVRFHLQEGRNRQIRALCDAAGLHIRRLTRIAYAGLQLGSLPPGKWRPLTAAETARLTGS